MHLSGAAPPSGGWRLVCIARVSGESKRGTCPEKAGEDVEVVERVVKKVVSGLETALESCDTGISTGRLNTFLKEVVAAHPPPVRGGKQPRILFATHGRELQCVPDEVIRDPVVSDLQHAGQERQFSRWFV